jgi:hypothetical protein
MRQLDKEISFAVTAACLRDTWRALADITRLDPRQTKPLKPLEPRTATSAMSLDELLLPVTQTDPCLPPGKDRDRSTSVGFYLRRPVRLRY